MGQLTACFRSAGLRSLHEAIWVESCRQVLWVFALRARRIEIACHTCAVCIDGEVTAGGRVKQSSGLCRLSHSFMQIGPSGQPHKWLYVQVKPGKKVANNGG
jgi:hypothetical protein